MGSRRIRLAVILLLPLLLAGGCWDKRELEDQAYVAALGIDKAPDGTNKRIITFQFVIPSKLAGGGAEGGGGGADKSFFQLSVRSRSIFDAADNLQASVSRKISLLQCRAVFISEDIARESIAPMLEVVERDPQLRRTIFFAIVKGSAKEFLTKNVPKLYPNISKYYEEVARSEKYTNYTTVSTFQRVIEGVESLGEDPIVTLAALNQGSVEDERTTNLRAGELPRTGVGKADFLGIAVFHRDKMVGTLGKEESELVNMLRGDWGSAPFVIQEPLAPKYPMGLNLRQQEMPKITVDLQADPIRIDVKLKFIGALASQFSQVDYTSDENRQKMEEAVKEEIETRAREVIDRAQHEFKADIFRFGNVAAKKEFLTWQEWQKFDWLDKFPKADIHVTADVSIRTYGMQNTPTQIAP